jgi:hypothetical protein
MIAEDLDRKSLLRRLLSEAESAPCVMPLLAEFNWDYDGQPVILTRQHLMRILRQFLSGELPPSKVEYWANCIEGRDDIAFETTSQSAIDALIFELANPALTQPMTAERAEDLLSKLRND